MTEQIHENPRRRGPGRRIPKDPDHRVTARLRADDHAYVLALGEGRPCVGVQKAIQRLRDLERKIAAPTAAALAAKVAGGPEDRAAALVVRLLPAWKLYVNAARPTRQEAARWLASRAGGRDPLPPNAQIVQDVLTRLEAAQGGRRP